MKPRNEAPELTWHNGWTDSRVGNHLTKLKWVSPDKTITLNGYRIEGMIYVERRSFRLGGPRGYHRYRSFPFAINPALTVAQDASERDWSRLEYAGRDFHWDQGYLDLTPGCRQAYLHWLATGRSDPHISLGYVCLFLAGIEHRIGTEPLADTETEALFREVERLRSIYGHAQEHDDKYHDSFCRTTEQLGIVYKILQQRPFQVPDAALDLFYTRKLKRYRAQRLPIELSIALGQQILDQKPLTSDEVLSWWLSHWKTKLPSPCINAFDEFRQLFALRFGLKHPDGLQVEHSKHPLTFRYRAVLGDFTRHFTRELAWCPDVTRMRKPLKIAMDTAIECARDLRAYSSYLSRTPHNRGTLRAHAYLPPVLRTSIPNPALCALAKWATPKAEEKIPIPVHALLAAVGEPENTRLTPARWRDTVTLFALVGIGLAPDSSTHLPALKDTDLVIPYVLPGAVTQWQEPGQAFRTALAAMTIHTFMIQAAGSFTVQISRVLDILPLPLLSLNEVERTGLEAHVHWMQSLPERAFASWRWLVQPEFAKAKPVWRKVIATAVTVNGPPSPSQIKAARKLFRAMQEPMEVFYRDVHQQLALDPAFEPLSTQPVTQAGNLATSRPKATVTVDHTRVSAITAETETVSRSLGNVFAKIDSVTVIPQVSTTHREPNVWTDLDPVHQKLVKAVMVQETLLSEELRQLAHQCGISMWAGAVETINEWAFREFQGPLLQEDEGWHIDPDIVQALHDRWQLTVS